MALNHGPTAFQSNAFQTNPLAFQIDRHLEEPVESGGVTPEAPSAIAVFTAEAEKTGLWAKAGAKIAAWAPEGAPANVWTHEDEPNPTP